VLLYVIILEINLHIFVFIVRRNVRQADCVMPCDMLLRGKDCFVSILFTMKCHVISYKLTPVFSDGVECTHLTLPASRSLQLYEFVHIPAAREVCYVAV